MMHQFAGNLRSIYTHLTSPPIKTDSVEDNLRMRLISILFLIQIVIALGGVIVSLLISATMTVTLFAVGVGVLSECCYLISRTRFYKLSIFLYIILMMSALFSTFASNPQHILPEYILSYLIAVIFFASLVLSVRGTIFVACFALIGIAGLPLLIDKLVYPVHFLWLFTLITSILIIISVMIRRDVLQRLQQSENRARNLMEATIDAVIIHSDQQGILAVNPAFTALLGYSAKHIHGTPLAQLANNDTSRTLIHDHSQQQEKTLPYEVHLTHQNGDSIIVELINQPYRFDNQPAQVFIARDMRKYKEALRQQHEQEIRYQSLLELTDEAVFISNFQGTYMAVNPQAADLLGVSVEELIGKSFHDFIPKAYHTASQRVLDRLREGETIPMYERTFVKANGHRFPAEVTVRLLRDMDDAPEFVHSVVRDISERKKAEDQRLELAIERERMSTLQQFLHDASHYFRTPLTSLKTSQYLLTQIHDNPEKQAHFLNVIKLEVARLEHLIADMMMSTELDKDAGDGITFGRMDLADFLPEIIETFSPSEKREQYANIVFESDIKPKSVFVMASLSKLSVAIHRVIENAITYSPPDSTVTIRAYQKDDFACIAISDEGIGITDEERSLLFQRFRRADRAIEMAHVGNGLGLFITQKIIEMHYGKISVDSTPDAGSTFTIHLPIAFPSPKLPITEPNSNIT